MVNTLYGKRVRQVTAVIRMDGELKIELFDTPEDANRSLKYTGAGSGAFVLPLDVYANSYDPLDGRVR